MVPASARLLRIDSGLNKTLAGCQGQLKADMNYSGKIVLVSTDGYAPKRDDQFLRDLIAARIELFCATGVGAEEWEDALDWACVGDDGLGEHLIVTTSHEGELLAEVIKFAEQFSGSAQHKVQVIHR